MKFQTRREAAVDKAYAAPHFRAAFRAGWVAASEGVDRSRWWGRAHQGAYRKGEQAYRESEER